MESEQANNTRQAYTQRIEELHNEAALDGIEVSRTSERDFWSFVRLGDPDRRAGVMLLDNGNLRAIWKSEDGSSVGIQFLGEWMAENVIFSRRPATAEISRVAGIDTLQAIERKIPAFDLILVGECVTGDDVPDEDHLARYPIESRVLEEGEAAPYLVIGTKIVIPCHRIRHSRGSGNPEGKGGTNHIQRPGLIFIPWCAGDQPARAIATKAHPGLRSGMCPPINLDAGSPPAKRADL